MRGIQNIPQLMETYGHNVTKTLIDLCSIKVMFRSASQDVAKYISEALGYQEGAVAIIVSRQKNPT